MLLIPTNCNAPINQFNIFQLRQNPGIKFSHRLFSGIVTAGFKPLHSVDYPQSLTGLTPSGPSANSALSSTGKGNLEVVLWKASATAQPLGLLKGKLTRNGGQKPEEVRSSPFCSTRQRSPSITTGWEKTHFKRDKRKKNQEFGWWWRHERKHGKSLVFSIWAVDTMRLPCSQTCASHHQFIWCCLK